jgi:hypothetical protein
MFATADSHFGQRTSVHTLCISPSYSLKLGIIQVSVSINIALVVCEAAKKTSRDPEVFHASVGLSIRSIRFSNASA